MARCPNVINACRLRATLLDSGGEPLAGDESMVVTDQLIRLTWGSVVTAGASLEQKNGCGTVCASYEGPDVQKGYNLGIELCKQDWELASLLTATSLIEVDGETRGTGGIPFGTEQTRRVGLEAWAMAWDGDQQMTDDNGDPGWILYIFPSTSWVEGDGVAEEGFRRIPYTGKARGNTQWGDGPDNGAMGYAWGDVVGAKAEFLYFGELPEATCGFQTLIAS